MDSPQTSISPIFREALERQRDEINARVHLLFKRGAKFEPADVLEHFRFSVAPIIDAIHGVLPERVLIATKELLEISLELFEANQLGSTARSSLMKVLWNNLLPQLPMLIGRDPRRVVGSLCNALHFLQQHDHVVASKWLGHLQDVGPHSSDAEQLLAIGRCAAWVSGFAPYRQQALNEARTLPPQLIGKLFGLSHPRQEVVTDDTVKQVLSMLETDRWAAPKETVGSEVVGDRRIRRVKVCCDFRGLGGALLAPPSVVFSENAFVVSDGEQSWKLIADRFGSILLRCDDVMTQGSERKQADREVFVDKNGLIIWGMLRQKEAGLAGCSSQAFDGQTLAVTIPTSFRVFLFALNGE